MVWPKHEDGERVVKERSIPPTCGNNFCPTGNNLFGLHFVCFLRRDHKLNSKMFIVQELILPIILAFCLIKFIYFRICERNERYAIQYTCLKVDAFIQTI